MRIFRRFIGDRRGTTFEGIALSASVIAVVCVASADLLSHMGSDGNIALVRESKQIMAAARGLPKSESAADIDYSPTGTIAAIRQRSVLDPCTGARR